MMDAEEIFGLILKIVVISVIFAIVKILIVYYIFHPVFNWCWDLNCKIFGIFGIENKTVLGITYFLVTCISPTSIKIALMLSD